MGQEPEHIKVIAHIRENATGVIHQYDERKLVSGSVWRDDEGNYNFFMWEEGNWSCDCNREIFFTDHDGDLSDTKCGDAIRYSVNLEIEGEIVYREYETETLKKGK